MKFTELFPKRYCLNLARRTDRRVACEELFETLELPVERFPAIDAKWLRHPRGFETNGRYAHAVGTRLMIRQAWLEDSPTVFIFEDDVSLPLDFHERLADIELPEDWGIFYLGCLHLEPPESVCPGLVRVKGALSTHAFGVRAAYYRRVMWAIAGKERRPGDSFCLAADASLARLHEEIPTYAVFPGLAGQLENHSDLEQGIYRAFSDDGQQVEFRPVLEGLMAESLGGKAYGPAREAALGYRGKAWFHTLAAPTSAWREAWESQRLRWPLSEPQPLSTTRKLTFLITGDGEEAADSWSSYLKGHEAVTSLRRIESHEDPLTRLKAVRKALGEAIEDEAQAFFMILSASYSPIRPFMDLARLLHLDPRSYFQWRVAQDSEIEVDFGRPIPEEYWRFHQRHLLLNRKAAVLLVEDDFTSYVAMVKEPEQCYWGTVLRMKGYPLDSLVEPSDLVFVEDPRKLAAETFSALAGKLLSSGAYFAELPGLGGDLAGLGMHLPYERKS